MIIRILAVIVLVAATATWSVSPASACSCATGDLEGRIDESSAVFVGRVISRTLPEGGIFSSADPITYTFQVETVVKGELREQVEVVSPAWGASCGYEGGVPRGERSGILLYVNSDGAYRGGLCSTVGADELLAFAGLSVGAPLPTLPGDQAPVPALNPDGTSDPGGSGFYIGSRALWAGAILLVLGYGVWQIFFRKRESA